MSQGNDALVINGTTGESPTTSDDEKLDLLDCIIEAIGADKVVAGAGGNDTRHIAKLAAASAAKGVAGILSVAPYYNKPCQEGIYRHFRAIADAAAIPVLLYNVPGRTIANIDAATTERIATDQENVIGTKEASGNMMQVADIVSRTPDTFDVYSGDDGTLLPHLAVGGCGIISVISHVATPQMKDVCIKWFAGDAAGARVAFLATLAITRMIFAQPSPAPTKAALSLLGKPAGPVRLPLVDLNQSQLEALAAFMTEQGLM
jgi:4-hydroxy-tetrahydrodipicolinate synthase